VYIEIIKQPTGVSVRICSVAYTPPNPLWIADDVPLEETIRMSIEYGIRTVAGKAEQVRYGAIA
jgi:hypothetical protein